MVGKLCLVHNQPVVPGQCGLLLSPASGLVGIGQVQVECHFDSYYCLSLATCAFV